MMGIGHSLGVPAPLVAGAVLSGVYFGDKLSPLSDSVVLASTMSNVDVMEHIKGMLPISLFSYVITAALFTALTDLVSIYGEQAVIKLTRGLEARVDAGEFTLQRRHQ